MLDIDMIEKEIARLRRLLKYSAGRKFRDRIYARLVELSERVDCAAE